jgi:hypothetical protein
MTKTLTIIAALLVVTAAAQAKAKPKPPTETWFCDVTGDAATGYVTFYKLPGNGGGKRKRDAVCE